MLKLATLPGFFKCILIEMLEEFFLRFYLFIFRQNGREGEREGEKYQCVVTS